MFICCIRSIDRSIIVDKKRKRGGEEDGGQMELMDESVEFKGLLMF